MQFRNDSEVFTIDHEAVGHVDRVVLDPKTKEVTHLIVRKGLLLTKDRVLPIDLVNTSDGKYITLTINAKQVDELSEYEEQTYVPIEEKDLPTGTVYYPSFYWYPLMPSAYPTPPMDPTLGYKVETHRNLPEQTIALKAGARVVDSDGEEVGHIEQISTLYNSDTVVSFVIARGLLVKEHRLVPMSWVKLITADEIQLKVTSARLDSFQNFEPA